jgi:hypothetical protein
MTLALDSSAPRGRRHHILRRLIRYPVRRTQPPYKWLLAGSSLHRLPPPADLFGTYLLSRDVLFEPQHVIRPVKRTKRATNTRTGPRLWHGQLNHLNQLSDMLNSDQPSAPRPRKARAQRGLWRCGAAARSKRPRSSFPSLHLWRSPVGPDAEAPIVLLRRRIQDGSDC